MIIGFCGQAGSGKDTSADFLVKNDLFVKVAFADPLKRICQEVYDFTDDQLWGPSTSRNAPDKRYPRKRVMKELAFGVFHEEETEWEYLTPRYALQKLGTEWGRDCYDNTWVDLALRIHDKLQKGDCYYDAKSGLRFTTSMVSWATPKKDVVISDVRFKNEIDAIRKAGGIVIKLLRGEGLEGAAGQHKSETELQGIPLESFDFIIDNREWTLNQLELYLHQLIQLHQGK